MVTAKQQMKITEVIEEEERVEALKTIRPLHYLRVLGGEMLKHCTLKEVIEHCQALDEQRKATHLANNDIKRKSGNSPWTRKKKFVEPTSGEDENE